LLDEEIIAGQLHKVVILIERRGAVDEFRGKEFVLGNWRAGADQNAVASPLQGDPAAQAEGVGPVGGELDTVAGFDRNRL
jgi:hypothetical protein